MATPDEMVIHHPIRGKQPLFELKAIHVFTDSPANGGPLRFFGCSRHQIHLSILGQCPSVEMQVVTLQRPGIFGHPLVVTYSFLGDHFPFHRDKLLFRHIDVILHRPSIGLDLDIDIWRETIGDRQEGHHGTRWHINWLSLQAIELEAVYGEIDRACLRRGGEANNRACEQRKKCFHRTPYDLGAEGGWVIFAGRRANQAPRH